MNKRRKIKALDKVFERMGISGNRDALVEMRGFRFPELHGQEITFVNNEPQKSFIENEKKRRKEGFRQSCIEILGEDPETDWS